VNGDRNWWVIGATTPNIVLTTPMANTSVSPPVLLAGQSTAFEGTVNVEIRAEGQVAPIKEDSVMGGSNGEMGPFSKSVLWDKPDASSGAIVLKNLSAEDGSTVEATVIPVTFA
jgi:hypothetical protein